MKRAVAQEFWSRLSPEQVEAIEKLNPHRARISLNILTIEWVDEEFKVHTDTITREEKAPTHG